MLFWMFIIFLIIGAVLWYIGETFFFNVDGPVSAIGAVMTIFNGFAVVVSIAVMIVNYAGAVADVNARQAEYESLVYQYESGMYDDDISIYRKELMDDIRDWNKDVSYKQAVQDDFWLGIYYPNVYDQLELIKLEE